MPFIILSDACILCGTCKEECPSGAIIESAGKYAITEDCMECAACLESCPSGAVVDA